MVGGRKGQQIVEAVKETASKAGTIVSAAFALAGAALLLALAVLVFAIRTRRS